MNADMAMHTVLDSRYTSLIQVVISFRWLDLVHNYVWTAYACIARVSYTNFEYRAGSMANQIASQGGSQVPQVSRSSTHPPKIESLGHPNDFGLREHDVSQTSVAYHFSPFLSSLLQNLQMWPFYRGKGTLPSGNLT